MTFKKGYVPWNKGLTKETDSRLKKRSEARKGIPLSEEHRRRISEGQKGRDAWNKGKPRSAETKRKISKANSGEHHPFYGEHLSEEHRRKISKARKGIPLSKEHRRKLSLNHHNVSGKNNPWYGKTGEEAPHYGKHHSEETKQHLSKILTGRIFSEEHNMKISKAMSGKNHPMYGKTGEESPRWLGGKSFEPYGVEFNDELKKQIRERDNYQCQLCGLYEEELSRSLDVHHIDYDKENNDPQNLVSLHDSCHAKTNVNRDYWEAYFKGAMAPLSSPILSSVCSPPAALRASPLRRLSGPT